MESYETLSYEDEPYKNSPYDNKQSEDSSYEDDEDDEEGSTPYDNLTYKELMDMLYEAERFERYYYRNEKYAHSPDDNEYYYEEYNTEPEPPPYYRDIYRSNPCQKKEEPKSNQPTPYVMPPQLKRNLMLSNEELYEKYCSETYCEESEYLPDQFTLEEHLRQERRKAAQERRLQEEALEKERALKEKELAENPPVEEEKSVTLDAEELNKKIYYYGPVDRPTDEECIEMMYNPCSDESIPDDTNASDDTSTYDDTITSDDTNTSDGTNTSDDTITPDLFTLTEEDMENLPFDFSVPAPPVKYDEEFDLIEDYINRYGSVTDVKMEPEQLKFIEAVKGLPVPQVTYVPRKYFHIDENNNIITLYTDDNGLTFYRLEEDGTKTPYDLVYERPRSFLDEIDRYETYMDDNGVIRKRLKLFKQPKPYEPLDEETLAKVRQYTKETGIADLTPDVCITWKCQHEREVEEWNRNLEWWEQHQKEQKEKEEKEKQERELRERQEKEVYVFKSEEELQKAEEEKLKNVHENLRALFLNATPSEIKVFIDDFNFICTNYTPVVFNELDELDKRRISRLILNIPQHIRDKTMHKMQDSFFLQGKKNNGSTKYKKWKADFKWFIKYNHFANVGSGIYDSTEEGFDINIYREFLKDMNTPELLLASEEKRKEEEEEKRRKEEEKRKEEENKSGTFDTTEEDYDINIYKELLNDMDNSESLTAEENKKE